MKRLFSLFVSLLVLSASFAQLSLLSDNVIAINDKASLDYLDGKTYLGVIKNGKYKFKKVKEINPELFDFVFMYYDGNTDAQYLFPLSSGQFDGKQPPFDVIKIITKKSYNAFNKWRESAFIVDNQKNFHFNRYKGQSYGTDKYFSTKGYDKLNSKTRKGIYYRYFYDHDSYYKKNTVNTLKTTENAKDIELAKQLVGYEIIYDHDKGVFGIIDVTDGKKYWDNEAVSYLEEHYLSSFIKRDEAQKAIAKAKADKEAAYPYGWAYFSNKGKGNIKQTMQCTIRNQNAIIVFSGYNKDDNVIDEVFVLPPANEKVEKDPTVVPPKVKTLHSYFQYGVNLYYIAVKEYDYSLDLYTEQNVIENVNRILNSSGKWINKSGVKYYHRDRWGDSHLM